MITADTDLARATAERFRELANNPAASGFVPIHPITLRNAATLLDSVGGLRAMIRDCQRDLAAYLPPNSGVTAQQVVSALLGRLDGPQARAVLAATATEGGE